MLYKYVHSVYKFEFYVVAGMLESKVANHSSELNDFGGYSAIILFDFKFWNNRLVYLSELFLKLEFSAAIR